MALPFYRTPASVMRAALGNLARLDIAASTTVSSVGAPGSDTSVCDALELARCATVGVAGSRLIQVRDVDDLCAEIERAWGLPVHRHDGPRDFKYAGIPVRPHPYIPDGLFCVVAQGEVVSVGRYRPYRAGDRDVSDCAAQPD